MSDFEKEQLARPRFVMMIGTYCAGKSTWTQDHLARAGIKGTHWRMVSFDQEIHARAAEKGLTPYELMREQNEYDLCTERMLENLRDGLRHGENIVFDNTNTAQEWRGQILDIVREHGPDYHKTGVCLHITREEGKARFEHRNATVYANLDEDQKVPYSRYEKHFNQYESEPEPQLEEGFDLIVQLPSEAHRSMKWAETISNANTGRLER